MNTQELHQANRLHDEIVRTQKLLHHAKNNEEDYLSIIFSFENGTGAYFKYIIEDDACINNLKFELIKFYELRLEALQTEFYNL